MTGFPALDEAHQLLRTAALGLSADDLSRRTPCAQWNVAQVLQHAAGDQRAYAVTLTGSDGPTYDPFAPTGTIDTAPDDLVGSAIGAAARAFAVVEPEGEAPTPLPQGVLPARAAAGAAALDAAVHAWDVSVAVGRPSPLGDELATELMWVAAQIVEPLRGWGAYAAALDPVAQDGPADELLRYLGRDPHWA